MGPLFNIALVPIALAFVAGITFVVSRLRGRTLAQAAVSALGFSFGALCAAPLGGLAAGLLIAPGTMLQSRAQVIGYLGFLTAVAGAGGVGLMTVVARRSNNRWRGP